MDNILFSSLPSFSTVCWELRLPGGFMFMFALPHYRYKKWIIIESIIKSNASKHCAKNNIYLALVLLLLLARQKTWGQNCCIIKTHKNLTEVNGESSLFFIWYAIKTKIEQDQSTTLKALLDVLNYYWIQKLVELRPSKNFGSNDPWDLGDLWQPVSDWYVLMMIYKWFYKRKVRAANYYNSRCCASCDPKTEKQKY